MRHWGLPNITKMTLLKFCQNLEQRIQEEIQDAYPTDWDEDYITRRILVAIKSLSYSQVEFLTTFNNIFIAAFKQKGVSENKHGDIAFVLDITYKDGDNIKGVAFLEAKRRYEGTNEYSAIKSDQLKRLYSHAPSGRLLLYNYNYMSNLAPTGIDGSTGSSSGILPKIPSTYTSAMPLNTAIHLNSKKDNLEKFTIPFSYQFTFRYLFGMDLEFGEDKVNAALGNSQNKENLPQYVVPITIKPGKKGEKQIDYVFSPEINKELFAEITDISRFDKE
jgi:hypothetical protein